MTYDLSKVEYDLVMLLPDGERLMLMDACEKLGWEENDGEFAARLNVTLRDAEGTLATKIPLCAAATLFADWGQGMREVFRGTVWEMGFSGMAGDPVTLTLYDRLYYLQKSQVNQYFAKGKGTKAILTELLKEWNVPIGRYEGPDVKHGKLLFKGKTIATILKDVLMDAEEKGGARCFARARENAVDILPYGKNDEVLMLTEEENLMAVSDRYDMTGMVTRVVIVGKEDKKGRPKVEATVNGRTEYGILQRIEQRGSATLSEAKKAAEQILKKDGQPARATVLSGVDMPALHKGDRVFVKAGALNGYCTAEGVAHDAAKRTMRVEVKPI